MSEAFAVTGEDLVIPAPDGGPAFAALPPGASRGVVVLHEIMGLQPEIKRAAQRLADNGYAAVAPDLFHGRPYPICIAGAVRSMYRGAGPHVDQIMRTREWLCERTAIAPERVGVIGFCLGGGFALVAGRGWGAISTNYGEVPTVEQLRGVAPVIGCYGGRDPFFHGKGEVLRQRLREAGEAEPEVHVFPNVGHSFLTDGDHPVGFALSYPLLRIRYDRATAEDGWARILAFFERHLGPAD